MNNDKCSNCGFRGWDLARRREQMVCTNPDSFKYLRRVLKGMTCNKFEKEREAA